MAEMTVSEAVALLHNNQYQKHIGNGEYDYIHPLTDAECKGIESLIKSQQQTIDRLKCCGNCKNYLTVVNEGRCFAGIKDIYRYDPNAKYASGEEVCDKWEGVNKDD